MRPLLSWTHSWHPNVRTLTGNAIATAAPTCVESPDHIQVKASIHNPSNEPAAVQQGTGSSIWHSPTHNCQQALPRASVSECGVCTGAAFACQHHLGACHSQRSPLAYIRMDGVLTEHTIGANTPKGRQAAQCSQEWSHIPSHPNTDTLADGVQADSPIIQPAPASLSTTRNISLLLICLSASALQQQQQQGRRKQALRQHGQWRVPACLRKSCCGTAV